MEHLVLNIRGMMLYSAMSPNLSVSRELVGQIQHLERRYHPLEDIFRIWNCHSDIEVLIECLRSEETCQI